MCFIFFLVLLNHAVYIKINHFKVNADSLAESAGLEIGDIIVRINDTPTAGLTHNEVHDLLLSAGLEFELGIRR